MPDFRELVGASGAKAITLRSATRPWSIARGPGRDMENHLCGKTSAALCETGMQDEIIHSYG